MNYKKLSRVCDSAHRSTRVQDASDGMVTIEPKKGSLRERVKEVLSKTNDGGAETVHAHVIINGDKFKESFYYENWDSHHISGPGFSDSWDNDAMDGQEDQVLENFLDWVEKNYPSNAKVSGYTMARDDYSTSMEKELKQFELKEFDASLYRSMCRALNKEQDKTGSGNEVCALTFYIEGHAFLITGMSKHGGYTLYISYKYKWIYLPWFSSEVAEHLKGRVYNVTIIPVPQDFGKRQFDYDKVLADKSYFDDGVLVPSIPDITEYSTETI